MLSRLIEGEARPVLLPAGEVVQASFRAFHAVYPAVTISDRVIMPDHVHFLMIVRYDQAPPSAPSRSLRKPSGNYAPRAWAAISRSWRISSAAAGLVH